MHEHKISEVKFHNIPVIDARLAELDLEKQQLIALKETLQKTPPNSLISNSFSLQQKVAIFSNLVRGRTDIFANRWNNQQGRSGYSVACNNEWAQGICHKPRIKYKLCGLRRWVVRQVRFWNQSLKYLGRYNNNHKDSADSPAP